MKVRLKQPKPERAPVDVNPDGIYPERPRLDMIKLEKLKVEELDRVYLDPVRQEDVHLHELQLEEEDQVRRGEVPRLLSRKQLWLLHKESEPEEHLRPSRPRA